MDIKKILLLLFPAIIICSDCTDINACNYNPDAIIDDGSCYYPLECPDNSFECDVNDCDFPDGFEWNQSSKILFLFIDYAYKFNSNYPLNKYEDWIGAFKTFDETQNGLCDDISENCPDVNSDGILTDNVEVCVGSKYWNGENNSEIGLMAYQNTNDLTNGYLEPGDSPYFKLFDSQSDSLYFMLPYKNGEEYDIIYSGNSSIEIMEIDSLVAQCPFYNNYDTDNDNIPDTCDMCPNDSNNDIDGDGICGNVDICPNDFDNDIDGDGICGDIDLCPNDFNNDIDGDGICYNEDICPDNFDNPDLDSDGICDDIDDCIGEYDACGICNGDGTWCLSAELSIGVVTDSIVEILYDSPLSIGGFQFNVEGVNILNVSGGDAQEAGFYLISNNNLVLGFSFDGNSIPPGSGVLTHLFIEVDSPEICLLNPIFSDNDGDQINIELGTCKSLPCVDIDNDDLCNYEDVCPNDFDNDIDGDEICGDIDICPNDFDNDIDGDGICGDIDQYPNCYDNFYDCFGICGGDAIIDQCGQCDGNNYDQCDFDNDGIINLEDICPNDFDNDIDGDGICGDIDLCPNDFDNDIDGDGICGDIDICPNDFDNDIDGDGICGDTDLCPNDFNNDIDGDGICGDIDQYPDCYDNFYDCFGICGGDAVIDECGICDGTGNCECPDFPDGVIPDCNGICDGGAFIDDCGICSEGDTNHDANSDMDCNGDCFGTAFEDDCGICSEGDTNHEANSDKDCAGECFGNSEIDECNVCGGDNTSCADCYGTPNGDAELDSCGVCSGGLSGHEADSDIDCNGDCFGEAFIDNCEVCSGGNSGHNENSDIDNCGICFGENQDMDCAGICFGDGIDIDNDNICDEIDDCIGEYDACGICNGDGTWCLEGNISFGTLTDTHLYILYDSPLDIGGFQFSMSGITIINAFGGATSNAGFNIANNEHTVVAFSLTNNFIPSGSGVLLILTIEHILTEACFYEVIFSDIDGDQITINIDTPCIDIECENEDLDDICDNVDDCFGVVDDCGVCNGYNDTCLGCTDTLACNYDENAIIDDQSCVYPNGSCDCLNNPIDDYCDCQYNIEDCWGDCGGNAYIDYCGDCVGGNSPYEEGFLDLGCDCHNPAPIIYCEDTDGDGFGNDESQTLYCLEDSPGNQYDTLPDNGWVEDCSDQCPDDVENDIDEDGVCESDEIFGCDDNVACNYNESVTENDGSCIYLEFENLLPLDNAGFIIDNDNIDDSLTFVWEMADTQCGDINYRLSVFDNIDPIIVRFTSDTNLVIPFSDLNIEDWIINNYNWNIYATNSQGLNFESNLFNFSIDATYLDNYFNDIPYEFFISNAYPNPFNPETSIDYGIPYYSNVNIKIYNSLGQVVYKAIDRYHEPGTYSFIWSPKNISSGTYYIQLQSEDIVISRKIIYLK